VTKKKSEKAIEHVQLGPLDGIRVELKYKNKPQREFADLIRDKEITICSGSPGTGKTIVSCFEALKLLKTQPDVYKEIVIVKSVTQLQGEDLGYLKGTLAEKMEPFIFSFIHNFEKIVGRDAVRRLRDLGMIRTMPIAMMRGINLDNCVVLVDEVQNITIQNAHTILTRIGYNCKMILLGDEQQSDIRNKKDSSLSILKSIFASDSEIGTIHFGDDCIVRNPLIAKIEERFRELA
jgi:phosphate starvation-inducible PhoH-like protein